MARPPRADGPRLRRAPVPAALCTGKRMTIRGEIEMAAKHLGGSIRVAD